jgi:hypothetical protein
MKTFVKNPVNGRTSSLKKTFIKSPVNGQIYLKSPFNFKEDFSFKKLLTFRIHGDSYNFEEGMTWEDWINSEYNVDGYFIHSNGTWVVYDESVYGFTALYESGTNGASVVKTALLKETTYYRTFFATRPRA